jgi:hypothetical protein
MPPRLRLTRALLLLFHARLSKIEGRLHDSDVQTQYPHRFLQRHDWTPRSEKLEKEKQDRNSHARSEDDGDLQEADAEASWFHAVQGRAISKVQRWSKRLREGHVSGNPTGLSVTWLGTSSGAPTVTRSTSCIALRSGSGPDETVMLVDCGMLRSRL